MNKTFYKRHKDKIWFSAMAIMMLVSFFVFGPLIEDRLIEPNKPYILVSANNFNEVQKAEARATPKCEIPPYTPIEIDSTVPHGVAIETVRLPMDRIPTEYMPYVHYPENWNKWYNIFNPSQPSGPMLMKILTVVDYILGAGLVAYIIYLWKKGKLKNILRRILPHD